MPEREEKLYLPEKIENLIKDKPYTLDNIGMSGNTVLLFEDMVLKIENDVVSAEEQVKIMRWLEGKLPVPQVLAYEETEEKAYLLMSKIGGKMSCDTYYLEHPHELLEALACGLKMLWQVDVTGCPCVRDLDVVLREARAQVENGLVDVDNVEPETFGEGGFESPKHLLEYLESHRPTFEPVLSHGDDCLPNVFLEDGQVKGFIDLGRAGIGDKWNDIALCYRSLKHNFDGTYGGKVYEDFNPDMLFEKLGIEPDWDKINYYLLLDELF
ncbi:MAG: aminoglycoside 3'-phosphotransferase [Lachnospiraceae bacterium]|nr:aminoglycoside 3'-phosphotransferase [Lachnospiraceae bacterium]